VRTGNKGNRFFGPGYFLVMLACLGIVGAAEKATANEWQDALNMSVAAQKGDVPTLKELLDSGVSIEIRNPLGETPLYDAAYNGRVEAVQFLLGKGADVNGGVPGGQMGTPLQGALLGKHLDMAKLLLTSGRMRVDAASPNASTISEGSLLEAVADAHDPELLKVFIARAVNIDPNKQAPATGWTVLDSAIISKHFDIATILLTSLHGWKFARTGMTQQTTLDQAVSYGTPDFVELILKTVPGQDVTAKSPMGLSPLDLAASNPEMLRVLVKYAKNQ
jgi:ankyrin repeat protein